mgnify:CR=1 FL=1
MKKTFLDLGVQPLANNFSKKYIPASFRLKLKFDPVLKLVMITFVFTHVCFTHFILNTKDSLVLNL